MQPPEQLKQVTYARRQSRFSPRYLPIERSPDARTAAATEVDARADDQLKIQVALGIAIMALFALSFVTVVTLLLLKPPPTGYLVLEPKSYFGGPNVEVDSDSSEAISMLLSRLSHQLGQVSVRRWGPLLGRGHREPRDCAREQRYPGAGEVCIPSVTAFGPCNSYSAFGYVRGDPCVLVKAGPQLAFNYTEDPRIACSVTGANLSITYYPLLRYMRESFTYFPRYFFPYQSGSQYYIAPMAMVQVMRPPKNMAIDITCWLANDAFENISTSAHLQLVFK